MPELPDLDILADATDAALSGRPLLTVAVAQPLVIRGTPTELEALRGQQLVSVAQRGKFLTFQFDRDRIVINPMLTGRLGLGVPGTKALPQTAFTMRFGARNGIARAPAWARGAAWLPPDDAEVELRYRDPTRMGKVYVLPEGSDATRWPDGKSRARMSTTRRLDLATWRTRIAKHSGELKNLLKNQAFVAGIGNGYSDEILWAARAPAVPEAIRPCRRRGRSAVRAAREVSAWAIGELRQRVPPRFEVEQRDFLKVHRKGGKPCPRCGTTLSEISPGGFVTTFCRGCQR